MLALVATAQFLATYAIMDAFHHDRYGWVALVAGLSLAVLLSFAEVARQENRD